MEYSIDSWRRLPKDLRWQKLIPKLKCPQCITFQGSNIGQLESHVILHCKLASPILNNIYINRLRSIVKYSDQRLIDLIRLTLEAKMLQWKFERHPIVPRLIEKHNPPLEKNQSLMLDLWRAWEKEMRQILSDHNMEDFVRLTAEAEYSHWTATSTDDNNEGINLIPADSSISSSLMSEVSLKVSELQTININCYHENIDVNDIERLQHEAFLLS